MSLLMSVATRSSVSNVIPITVGSLLDVPTHTVNMVTVRSQDDLWESYSMNPHEVSTNVLNLISQSKLTPGPVFFFFCFKLFDCGS